MPYDVAAMASFIALALYGQAIAGLEDEPDWLDLDEDTQAQFVLAAHTAMAAHDAWLTSAGFRLVKMNRKARRAIETPGLVDANGRKLVGKA